MKLNRKWKVDNKIEKKTDYFICFYLNNKFIYMEPKNRKLIIKLKKKLIRKDKQLFYLSLFKKQIYLIKEKFNNYFI